MLDIAFSLAGFFSGAMYLLYKRESLKFLGLSHSLSHPFIYLWAFYSGRGETTILQNISY